MQALPLNCILGVMGSGQLGRMFGQSAIREGYRISCYSPASDTPCGQIGAREYCGAYTDIDRLKQFLAEIDALTFEFENIPEPALEVIEDFARERGLQVHPSVEAIRIAQNRTREKSFFQQNGLPTTPFFSIASAADFEAIKEQIPLPCIIKTNSFGYDGKGQQKIHSITELQQAVDANQEWPLFIEKMIHFDLEASVIIARFADGKIVHYPASQNIHKNHILDITIQPAHLEPSILETCYRHAIHLTRTLDYVGVLGLEFFINGSEVLCNEYAPRPHNSGHFSMNGFSLSQFDLQLRTLCHLSAPHQITSNHCIMKNILGENMHQLTKEREQFYQKSNYFLHLYGKQEHRTGRKMGHWNYTGTENYKQAFGP